MRMTEHTFYQYATTTYDVEGNPITYKMVEKTYPLLQRSIKISYVANGKNIHGQAQLFAADGGVNKNWLINSTDDLRAFNSYVSKYIRKHEASRVKRLSKQD
jgi:hypothetical protein